MVEMFWVLDQSRHLKINKPRSNAPVLFTRQWPAHTELPLPSIGPPTRPCKVVEAPEIGWTSQHPVVPKDAFFNAPRCSFCLPIGAYCCKITLLVLAGVHLPSCDAQIPEGNPIPLALPIKATWMPRMCNIFTSWPLCIPVGWPEVNKRGYLTLPHQEGCSMNKEHFKSLTAKQNE